MKRCLLSLLALIPSLALAAIPTVQITGSIRDPGGIGVSSGTVTCNLSQPGSVMDGATSVRVAAQTTITLAAGGGFPASAALIPNDVVVPAGTAYRCTVAVTLANGLYTSWPETLQVASTPNPIDFGAIPRLNVIPGYAVSSLATNPQFFATAATGVDGLLLNSGARLCLDQPACTNTLRFDGTFAAFSVGITAPSYTSTAASGQDAFAATTVGARVRLGPTASAYMVDAGDGYISTPGYLRAAVLAAGQSLSHGTGSAAGFVGPGGGPANIRGNHTVDGAGKIGVRLGMAQASSFADAKIAAFYSDAMLTEKAYVKADGAYVASGVASGSKAIEIPVGARISLGGNVNNVIYSDSSTNVYIGDQSVGWVHGGAADFAYAVYSGAFVSPAGLPVRFVGFSTGQPTSTSVGTALETGSAFSIDGQKLVSVRNLTTEKTYIDKDGSIAWRDSPVIRTCSVDTEGLVARQAGGTSGTRTKLCLCTSDGGATPAYAWKNISNVFASEAASVGTTTTCP